MKKLTFLLQLIIFFALNAFADAVNINGIYYNLNNSDYTAEVTRESSVYYSGNVSIPKEVSYNGRKYSVTHIGDRAFDWCSSLTSVTIPNSVTSIGEFAFDDCI